ncbi:MAG: hypothetical protein FD121_1630, partial [Gallionellaceae bacterium]
MNDMAEILKRNKALAVSPLK